MNNFRSRANVIIDLEKYRYGFMALDDTTKAPFGALRIMRNAQVTDRGGLAPRPGTQLFGTYNSNGAPIRGFDVFKKSFDQEEILLKAYDDELEFMSLNYPTPGWNRLKNGFTVGGEFGFVTSLVNTDNQDYTIFCNRYESYMRWGGVVASLTGSLAGGETSIPVDSTLTQEAFDTQTATSSSATTLSVSTAPWAADQWVNFYVYILNGTLAGKVRQITAVSTTQITFTTLGGDPGLCNFEIRQLKFPGLTGSVIVGGTVVAYTGIDTSTTLTVSSAPAAAAGSLVASIPDQYPANPRGNRLCNYLTRIVVGNVRSAIARGTGGAKQGYSSGGSYFVSKVNIPTDFTFSAARVAGEGDIVATPYGGGEITDVVTQEDGAYILKRDYIESVTYSQDTNDLAVRTPLKAGIGSTGKTLRGSDDVYFITPDNQITSIGRVKTKDIKPSTFDIGYSIRRYMENAVVDDVGRGREINNKLYFPIKSSSEATYNDVVLVYNVQYKMWEGIWDIGAFGIIPFGGDSYYAESNGSNVYKMFVGNSDVVGTRRDPVFSEVATHFFNLTGSKSNEQAMSALVVEGYILDGTIITFNAWKDFETDPFLTFNFSADEIAFIDGTASAGFLGSEPFALDPLGAGNFDAELGESDENGRRHFEFIVYFPFQYGRAFSVGHSSDGVDFDYEIIRYGLGLKEDVSVDTSRIKTI